MMSPEMELLDQLLGGDMTLALAWEIFGGPLDPKALPRARRAIMMQEQDGLTQVVRHTMDGEEVMKGWQVREILSNDEEWGRREGDGVCYLRVTYKGGTYVA